MNAAQLTINQQPTDKGFLIQAVGEVDLTTAPLLKIPLMENVNTGSGAVIVDLSQVEFIDSAGLALLVEARKGLAKSSRLLHVLLTSGRQPERVLKLGRFDTIMNLAYGLDEVS